MAQEYLPRFRSRTYKAKTGHKFIGYRQGLYVWPDLTSIGENTINCRYLIKINKFWYFGDICLDTEYVSEAVDKAGEILTREGK